MEDKIINCVKKCVFRVTRISYLTKEDRYSRAEYNFYCKPIRKTHFEMLLT